MRPPDKYAATFEVSVNGQAVDKLVADRLFAITIEDSLGLPDVCRLQVGFETAAGRQPHIDESPFAIGDGVEVKMGERDGPPATQSIFKGEILAIEPTFNGQRAQTEIRAYDASHRLHGSVRTRTWAKLPFSDVVQSICAEAGLRASVDAMPALEHLQQSNESDYQFIWRIADRFGYEIAVEGAQLTCRKPDPGQKIALTIGEDLLSFNPRLTSVQQYESVIVTGYDALASATVTSTASSPEILTSIGKRRDTLAKGELNLVLPVQNGDDCKAVAQGLLNRIAEGYAQAEGTTFGNPKVRAGAVIEVKGIGKDFSGDYRVHSTRHTISGGGTYQTAFTTYETSTIAGLAPGGGSGGDARVPGRAFHDHLVVATVKDNVDPDGLGRLSVWFPTLPDGLTSTWARVATLGAGRERGVQMLPLVGDEVLVAFEHGDASRPYVLGTLHNSDGTPHSEQVPDDSPFVVRSDTRITMRAMKEIEIEAGETYTLKVTKDGTETFDGKLETTVQGDVKLEAKTGNITLKAGQGITVEGSSSVKVKGMTVDVEAQTQLNLKGNAGVSIDGGPMVQIKGGMINLG